MKLEFSGQIFKKYSNVKFMTICLVAAELFCVDGRTYRHTDTMKLTVAFQNFVNMPKKPITCTIGGKRG